MRPIHIAFAMLLDDHFLGRGKTLAELRAYALSLSVVEVNGAKPFANLTAYEYAHSIRRNAENQGVQAPVSDREVG